MHIVICQQKLTRLGVFFLLVIVVNQTDIVLMDVIEGLREKMS